MYWRYTSVISISTMVILYNYVQPLIYHHSKPLWCKYKYLQSPVMVDHVHPVGLYPFRKFAKYTIFFFYFKTKPCLPTWSVVCTIFRRSSRRVRPQHIGLQKQSVLLYRLLYRPVRRTVCVSCLFTPVRELFNFQWLI